MIGGDGWIFAVSMALLIVALVAFAVAWCSWRRRVAMSHYDAALGSIDEQVGISVLCVDADDLDQVESMLRVEYLHYEVVVSVDPVRNRLLMKHLIGAYYLIELEPFGDSSRHLFRSRRSAFRRLTMVVGVEVSVGELLDVAQYNYYMAVRKSSYLLFGTVEQMVVELAMVDSQRVCGLRSLWGDSVTIYDRRVDRRCRRINYLNIMICYNPRFVRRYGSVSFWAGVAVVWSLLTIVAAACGVWGGVALSLSLVWCVVALSQLVRSIVGGLFPRARDYLCYKFAVYKQKAL